MDDAILLLSNFYLGLFSSAFNAFILYLSPTVMKIRQSEILPKWIPLERDFNLYGLFSVERIYRSFQWNFVLKKCHPTRDQHAVMFPWEVVQAISAAATSLTTFELKICLISHCIDQNFQSALWSSCYQHVICVIHTELYRNCRSPEQ
jgi:hypothetical protein